MPRQSPSPQENDSPVAEAVNHSLYHILPHIQFFSGVNRKANTGNFETIDIYNAIMIPVGIDTTVTESVLREVAKDVIGMGFDITSTETWDRYSLIKEMQKG